MELRTSQITAALSGCNLSGDTAEKTYRGVATDTRADCTGRLFVALRGESFDANEFLQDAAESGATGALIGPSARNHPLPESLQFFEVRDTLAALHDLGSWARGMLDDLKVAAVTGSNGKTTTKEMIAAVTRTSFRTHATPGNLNNHIGVPLTLLAMDPGTEVLVSELGANHPGEIRALARIVRPGISVITNVGPVHLEGFGSVDGVLRAKTELFDETADGGAIIYCGDNELLSGYVPGKFDNTISFGLGAGNDIAAENVVLDPNGCASFTVAGGPAITLAVPGRHSVLNALAAVAVGRSLEIGDDRIKAALEATRPVAMRGQLRTIGSWRVLDDSYNANPLSMREALKTLLAMDHDGPRVAVLGQMLELGPDAPELHRQLAADAAGMRLDMVVMVGEYAGQMKEAWAAADGENRKAFSAADADRAWDILEQNLSGGELLLIKGSRGMRLEKVIEKMAAREDE